MILKRIFARNPNPKDTNGAYIKFEHAKCVNNKVKLTDYNMVLLSFSKN